MLPVVWFPFLCTVLFSAVLVTLCVCATTPLRKRTLSGCITAKAFQSSIIPFGTKLAHSGGHDEVESFCESEASHTDLPVRAPGRLVNLSATGPKEGRSTCGNLGDCDSAFSYPMFRDLEHQQNVFTGIAAHVFFPANLSYEGKTEHVLGLAVSGSYFPVLDLQPALGQL